jgi:hypothetical protein
LSNKRARKREVDKEFIPLNHDVEPVLNKEQLEMLEDIVQIIAEALIELSKNSQEGEEEAQSSWKPLHDPNHNQEFVASQTNEGNVNYSPT